MNAIADGDTAVTALQSCLYHGQMDLETLPGLLKRIIREELWRCRYASKIQREVRFERFVDFVTAPKIEGLGSDVETLKKFCQAKGDVEALDELEKATTEQHGGDRSKINNVKLGFPQGNSAQRSLRTLRKKRPDLHARVLAKELSPHAAMIEAGLRVKTLTVAQDPERAVAALTRHFDREELEHICIAILKHLGLTTYAD